jgi:hypothetical protein
MIGIGLGSHGKLILSWSYSGPDVLVAGNILGEMRMMVNIILISKVEDTLDCAWHCSRQAQWPVFYLRN